MGYISPWLAACGSDRCRNASVRRGYRRDVAPAERAAVVVDIARNPEGGDLIPGGGGLRKRRIALPGRGKRGGARVITLYLGDRFPVYAVFVFAKNERADLSPEQKRVLLRLVEDIKARARAKS